MFTALFSYSRNCCQRKEKPILPKINLWQKFLRNIVWLRVMHTSRSKDEIVWSRWKNEMKTVAQLKKRTQRLRVPRRWKNKWGKYTDRFLCVFVSPMMMILFFFLFLRVCILCMLCVSSKNTMHRETEKEISSVFFKKFYACVRKCFSCFVVSFCLFAYRFEQWTKWTLWIVDIILHAMYHLEGCCAREFAILGLLSVVIMTRDMVSFKLDHTHSRFLVHLNTSWMHSGAKKNNDAVSQTM